MYDALSCLSGSSRLIPICPHCFPGVALESSDLDPAELENAEEIANRK